MPTGLKTTSYPTLSEIDNGGKDFILTERMRKISEIETYSRVILGFLRPQFRRELVDEKKSDFSDKAYLFRILESMPVAMGNKPTNWHSVSYLALEHLIILNANSEDFFSDAELDYLLSLIYNHERKIFRRQDLEFFAKGAYYALPFIIIIATQIKSCLNR